VIPREWRKFGGIPAQKQTQAGTNQAGNGRRVGRRFRAGARQIVRFEKGPLGAADVAYMSQIGDIFDIVQQIAKSIP
jgi:hypothetical protein